MLQARFPALLTAAAGMLTGIFAPATLGASSPAPSLNNPSCAGEQAQAAQWWLDLRSAPIARTEAAQRPAQLQKINAEQAEVTQAAQALGACVIGSVQRVRNAVAVQATAAQLQALRKLPQVRSARPVTHIHRTGEAPAQSPTAAPHK